jgi:hypothetical protein
MTRTDVMASSRPQNVNAVRSRKHRRRILCALPVALLLALAVALPGTALAASGYAQEPNKPATTTPKTGTLPSKEAAKPTPTPASETVPTTTSTTPTPKASTLPFTGFDLRWDIGFGVVLLGAGFSILTMQRRQRRGSER